MGGGKRLGSNVEEIDGDDDDVRIDRRLG